MKSLLLDFTGDLAWLHDREAHAGRPYWPTGASGVTLDPGLDIRHADWSLVVAVIGLHITDDQLRRLESCRKLSDDEAWAACADPAKMSRELAKLPPTVADRLRPWWGRVADIRISRDLAERLLPQAADPYWRDLIRRFPALATAPGPVQTGMLSLGYNRGAWNRALVPLSAPLRRRDWREVGRIVAAMQQSHRLKNIRERRQLEGDLIASAAKET